MLAGATLSVLAFSFWVYMGLTFLGLLHQLYLALDILVGIHIVHEKEAREADDKRSMIQIIIRWKWIIIAIALLLAIVFSFVSGKIRGVRALNFSSDADRYEYDSNNILGIKATVIDGRNDKLPASGKREKKPV